MFTRCAVISCRFQDGGKLGAYLSNVHCTLNECLNQLNVRFSVSSFHFVHPLPSPLFFPQSSFSPPFSNTKNFAYLIKRFAFSIRCRHVVLCYVATLCKHDGKNFVWFMRFEERKIAIRVTFEYLPLYICATWQKHEPCKKNNGNSKMVSEISKK